MSTSSNKRSRPHNGNISQRQNGEAAAVQAAPPRPEREPKLALERVGDMLRNTRERRGENLEEIADYLCIRRGYLVALENNRYDELPADAYVIGFLRSYANLLGLDGREVIDRYRNEMAGRRKKPTLTIPTPIAESRTPSAAVMIGAAVAAILIYGLWYGLSSSDRAVISAAPPLTADQPLMNAPAENPAPAAPATTASATPASMPAPSAAAPAATPAASSIPATAAPQVPAMAVPAPTPFGAQAPALLVPSAASPAAAANKAPAAPAQSTTVTNAWHSAPHLVIRAEKESWVLVTDANGHTVYDHVMKPGDSYHVPEKDGLKMTTGNSNGIVLTLDGADLPAFSGTRVMHDIPLDPAKLQETLTKSPSPAN